MLIVTEPDLERRFGGLRRLYGDAAYDRIRGAHAVVVGLGGVGSWTAEALARSGVAALTLIDLDHVSESNVNRQIQALESTLGQSKAEALAERIAQIHPGCRVRCVEEFVEPDNWPALLESPWPAATPAVTVLDADGDGEIEMGLASPSGSQSGSLPVAVVVDACDQVRAKGVMAGWSLQTGTPLVMVGAAGGKRRPQAVEADDLARVTHDPLLASLRQRLRKFHGGARTGDLGLRCVFSREPVVQPPAAVCEPGDATAATDGSLNCHGYGSSVTVTATFGMVAAAEALAVIISPAAKRKAGLVDANRSTKESSNTWPSGLSVI